MPVFFSDERACSAFDMAEKLRDWGLIDQIGDSDMESTSKLMAHGAVFYLTYGPASEANSLIPQYTLVGEEEDAGEASESERMVAQSIADAIEDRVLGLSVDL